VDRDVLVQQKSTARRCHKTSGCCTPCCARSSGSKGLVISDWGAVYDRVAALKAGTDLEMPTALGRSDRQIISAVEAGEIPVEVLDTRVRTVLELVSKGTNVLDIDETFDAAAHTCGCPTTTWHYFAKSPPPAPVWWWYSWAAPPVELGAVTPHANALVAAWLGGQAVGGAITDVVTGAVNPSGRLAQTFPHRLEDNSSFLNFPGRPARLERNQVLSPAVDG
jgi:hypothetical protein